MNVKRALFYLLCFGVFVGRMFITPRLTNIPSAEGSYEAFAHLLVGFLILVPFYDTKQQLGSSRLYGWIGWGLATWELVMFLVQKTGMAK